MATAAEYYISAVVCTPLGLMFTFFAILNLIHDTGVFGSFGRKFGYEMDVIMGGLLGIPHYSKIEFLMIGFGGVGALSSWILKYQLITVLGLISAASYMYICAFYAYFAKLWKEEGPLFVVMGTLCLVLGSWRWVRFLDGKDGTTAMIGAGSFAALTVIAGAIMMIRAPAREAINYRFKQIFAYCEANKDFVWSAGQDAPEGFSDKLLAQ